MKIKHNAHVTTEQPINAPPAEIDARVDSGLFVNSTKLNVSVKKDKIKIPIKKPRSAKRVTINAFFEAETADGNL